MLSPTPSRPALYPPASPLERNRPPHPRLAMHKTPRIAVAFATLLISKQIAGAQTTSTLPIPPTVIVNGSVMTGGGGSYSTNNFGGGGGPASLTISGGQVSFGGQMGGYWTQAYLITPGYWQSGYTTPGYYSGGYMTDGYWDGDGNYVPGYYVQGQWVDGVTVDGYYVPDVWSTPSFVPYSFTDTGAYNHFAFQMSSGTNVQPADVNGNAWTTVPQFSIPAVRVGKSLYQFNAADTVAAYDYFRACPKRSDFSKS